MKWMYEHALARANEFGIQASLAAAECITKGMDAMHTLSQLLYLRFATMGVVISKVL